jgi:hypothetical protein
MMTAYACLRFVIGQWDVDCQGRADMGFFDILSEMERRAILRRRHSMVYWPYRR